MLTIGTHNYLVTGIAALSGLLIGSFLNVVIHRLPKMMLRESANYIAYETGQPLPHTDRYNLLVPRSACPHCNNQLANLHNIPILSYLLLRGRCNTCQTKIAAHYPLVEALCGLLSAWLIWHFGFSIHGMVALVFAYFLLTLSFIDTHTQLLPDNLTLPLLWLGLLINLHATFTPLTNAVLGATAGYLVLWCIDRLFKFITGKNGIGYGDFKLMAALGAWLGWQLLPFVLLFASCLGAFVSISLIALNKQDKNSPIPFGPYLAFAGLLALPYGTLILDIGLP